MDSTELLEQMEDTLKNAEDAVQASHDRSAALICQTLLACTRALCMEMNALRNGVDGIGNDLSNIDYKIPEQD